jgi:hypothetical protein
VRNNIFVAEGKAAFYSGTITESNNLYWDLQRTTDASADPWVQFNSASQTSLDATSRSVDPSFVDAAKDWHLQANSPAVDGGASIQTPDARITSFLGNDLDGNAWSGDIGAYSYP